MQVVLYGGPECRTVAAMIERVTALHAWGFETVWFPQTAGLDTITALAAVGQAVPQVALGTAVVPIQGRHPITLAQQALTLASVAGESPVTIGLGVTHAELSEGWYRIPYRGIVDVCDEFLQLMSRFLQPERQADFRGDHFGANVTIEVEGPTPSLMLAALGPRMLDLAGRLTDGTVTWMVGPRGLQDHIVPALSESAERAGRPSPQVVVGTHVCVTDDVSSARDRLNAMMGGSNLFASYQRTLAAEQVDDAADLALYGPEERVREGVARLHHAGATALMASVVGTPAEQERTLDLLRTMR
jgi:F420-dependent oxidoreductase-like protein